MSIVRRFLKQYWSLIASLLVVALQAYAPAIGFEPVEFHDPVKFAWTILCIIAIILIALCLGLIVHSWQIQRRLAKNQWRLAFWTHLLLIPALCSIVLGLDAVYDSTYAIALERGQFRGVHRYAGDSMGFLIWFVALDFVLMILWATIAIFKNKSGRPDPGPA
jgi:hypothetical protein